MRMLSKDMIERERRKQADWSLIGPTSSTEYGSVRKRNLYELAAIGSVAKRMDDCRDGHPRDERLRFPALAHQTTRSIQLDSPLLLTSSSFNRQHDPGMRTRPLELLDSAL